MPVSAVGAQNEASIAEVSTMADVAEPRSDWRTCCRPITAGLPCPSSDISTAAKYSNAIAIQRCSMSFGLTHRALTRLNAAHAVTLQARG